jgi:hypothetical protein
VEPSVPFAALHRFLCAGGSIDVGRIDVWRYAAVACDAKSVRVVLNRRQDEALHELLPRLDAVLDQTLRSGQAIDEIGSGAMPMGSATVMTMGQGRCGRDDS